jgi:hypothetical protein
VSSNRIYQNQPVLLTYKIYTRVNVSQYSLINAPDTAGFWSENLLKNQQQAETSQQILNGQQYTVAAIWKQVMFPTTPGKRTINPMEIECQVRVRGSRRSVFDDFFSDPFSSDFFGRSVPYVIRSKPIEFNILPLPEEGKPINFTGIVGEFELSGGVDNTQVKTNDVVNYIIKVSGSGNLRAVNPPQLVLSPGIESYEPEISENFRAGVNGLTGSKSFKYLLVPRTPGEKTIQEVKFTFFNPDSKSYKTQTISPVDLLVEGSASITSSLPPSLSKENIRLLAQEIRFIKLDSPVFQQLGLNRFYNPLFLVIILTPVFLVAGAGLYRRHMDKLIGDEAYARKRGAGKQVKLRLKGARDAISSENDEGFYTECGKALRGFAADQLNLPESALMSESISSFLTENGVESDIVIDYVECLETCEKRLFSPLKSTLKEREDFYQSVEKAITRLNRGISK